MEEEKRQRLFNQKVASPGFWTVPSSFQPEKETETERQRQRGHNAHINEPKTTTVQIAEH